MSNIINRAFMMGLGAVSLSREKLEDFLDDLVKRGEVSYEEKQGVLSDLLKSVEKQRTEITEFVQQEVQHVLRSLDVPSREDIAALKKEIARLKEEMTSRGDS